MIVFDYGNQIESSANGLVAFNILLVPALFVPFLDVKVQSYLDSFVVDTRNGYLYAHVAAQQEAQDDYLTIYSSAGKAHVEAQWPELLQETAAAVAKMLGVERVGHRAVPAVTTPMPAVAARAASAPTPVRDAP